MLPDGERLQMGHSVSKQNVFMHSKKVKLTRQQAQINRKRKRNLKKDPVLESDKVLSTYGRRLGLRRPLRQMIPSDAEIDRLNFIRVNYVQRHRQVPVFGTNLRVHFGNGGDLKAINGRILPDIKVGSTKPLIKANEALEISVNAYKEGGRDISHIITAKKGLFLLNRGFLENRDDPETHLVWLTEISNVNPLIGELYFVDARSGAVVFTIDDVRRIYRKVYDCSLLDVSDPSVSGYCWSNKVWNGHRYGRIENATPAGPNPMKDGSTDTDTLYDYSGLIHQYYQDKFNRPGLNWKGGMGLNATNSDYNYMKSQVHSEGTSYDDVCLGAAFYQDLVVFGTGEATPDTAGHEFAHAITYYHG